MRSNTQASVYLRTFCASMVIYHGATEHTKDHGDYKSRNEDHNLNPKVKLNTRCLLLLSELLLPDCNLARPKP
jgi:hypothetical protein